MFNTVCPGEAWNGYRTWRFAADPCKKKGNPTAKVIGKLYDKGYRIVFITNQSGLGRARSFASGLDGVNRLPKSLQQKRQDFADKVTEICQIIDQENGKHIPILIIAGTSKKFQKPCASLWKLLLKNNGGKVSCKKSFYCGDVAGRSAGNTTDVWQFGPDARDPDKPDKITPQDQLFAYNAGIVFYTPEEVFFGEIPLKQKTLQNKTWKDEVFAHLKLKDQLADAKCPDTSNVWGGCTDGNITSYPSFPK